VARDLPAPFSFIEESSWAPFSLFQREMSRLFDEARGGEGSGSRSARLAPRVDVRESDEEFRISMELPGVSEDDVEVDVDEDLLTVRAEKKEDREIEGADQHVTERLYGVFQRSIRLPQPVDPRSVRATLQNGVLQITIPKSQHEARSRRVPVGRGDQQASSSGDGSETAGRAA
jgi:HSP20 family protein